MVWPIDQIYAFGSRFPHLFTFARPVPNVSVQLSNIRALVIARPRVRLARIYSHSFAHFARQSPAWTPQLAYRWLSFCYDQSRSRGDVGPVSQSPEWIKLQQLGGRAELVDEIIFEEDVELVWKPVVMVGAVLREDVHRMMIVLYYEGFAGWFLEEIVEEMYKNGLWITVERLKECALGATGASAREWVFDAVEGLQDAWVTVEREEADIRLEQEQRVLAALQRGPMNWKVDFQAYLRNCSMFANHYAVFETLASRHWKPVHAWRWVSHMVRDGLNQAAMLERAQRFPEDKLSVFDEMWYEMVMQNVPVFMRGVIGQLLRKGYDYSYLVHFYNNMERTEGRRERFMAALIGEDIESWLNEWVSGPMQMFTADVLDDESAMNLKMVDENREFVREWGLALRVFSQRGWPPAFSWQVVRALVEAHDGKKGAVIWAAENVKPKRVWKYFVKPRIQEAVRRRTAGAGDEQVKEIVRICRKGWSLEYLLMILEWSIKYTRIGGRRMMRTRLTQDPEEWLWSWAPGLEDIWTRAGYFDTRSTDSSEERDEGGEEHGNDDDTNKTDEDGDDDGTTDTDDDEDDS
ncbi:unnamed protein product [Zymoseptoria tritici ST99CH_1A5]|uniref:Uncharacterized protein n=1 Tax=Zymoseptoria tritici ST99CH_1A5 TaxID=1276529 RepID=A0A1Y6LM81_ZYMTR|nr:unnamed protein product [Zymoseptoria tritici ST99CH_1A5]